MARYSSAYSQFLERLSEIRTLVAVASRMERATGIPKDFAPNRALYRGGVVLLCSHIEGYIGDLGALGISRIGERSVRKDVLPEEFKYHLSRDLIGEIRDARHPESIAGRVKALVHRDGEIWGADDRFRDTLAWDVFVRGFSVPKHENVCKFFRRFGYWQFDGDLAARLRGNTPACVNVIDHVVAERNKIAHGDYLASGTSRDLENMHKLVRLYCRTTDEVVGDWFSSKGCAIRS